MADGRVSFGIARRLALVIEAVKGVPVKKAARDAAFFIEGRRFVPSLRFPAPLEIPVEISRVAVLGGENATVPGPVLEGKGAAPPPLVPVPA